MTLADFFNVSPRTIRRWKEAGADLQSAGGLLRYLRGIERPAAGVETRLADPSAEADLENLLDGMISDPVLLRQSLLTMRKHTLQIERVIDGLRR
jgi:hypothetical protein